MSSYTDKKIMTRIYAKRQKNAYALSVSLTFLIGLIIAMMMYPEDSTGVAENYLFYTAGMFLVLWMGYWIEKSMFRAPKEGDNEVLKTASDEEEVSRIKNEIK